MSRENSNNSRSVDDLFKLHGVYADSLAKRISTGWQMSIALWSALGALAGFLLTAKSGVVSVSGCLPYLGGGGLLLILAGYLFFACRVGKANRADQKKEKWLKKALWSRVVDGKNEVEGEKQRRCRIWKDWYSQVAQVLVTTGLVVIVIVAFLTARKETLPRQPVREPGINISQSMSQPAIVSGSQSVHVTTSEK